MGCAVKTEGDALAVGIYGEWDSHIEGGADMKLVVVVAEGLAVEHRKGLSRDKSSCWDRVAGSMAAGWKAIPDEPDPERTAN
jgi:hypothetical protein